MTPHFCVERRPKERPSDGCGGALHTWYPHKLAALFVWSCAAVSFVGLQIKAGCCLFWDSELQ